MTIHAQDIKLRPSRVMADVPEGGGGPAPGEIGFGDSNTVFDDIDSVARTMGNVSIRQLHMHVDTPDTDRLLGAYAVVAKLPSDPNVSVTLATCEPFSTRSEISQAIANYLVPGTPWNGYLLGNHVKGQGNIQIFQRPGTSVPTVGRTLVLVVNEGQPNEQIEWVRVIKVESAVETFTDERGDYQAMVVRCDLQSGLSQALPGTDPNRFHTRGAGKALVRDSTEADAANYFGAASLSSGGALGATSITVDSVYSQLVPSSSTAVPSLDQRPAAQRLLVLAESPRRVEVPSAPHTRRVKIGQENRGLSYVFQLTPLPEPGSITVTWVGLGNRYTIEDDGQGALAGAGVGVVNALTGSLSITLPSLPDVGSAIVVSYGARVAYTNRSSQGALVRAPEYAFELSEPGYNPGTLVVTWTSGGALKTASADGAGVITGDATGLVDAPSGLVLLRPTAMIDAGLEFHFAYETLARSEETLIGPSIDGAGFATLSLADQPVAGTVQVQWMTRQTITASSGGQMTNRSAGRVLADTQPLTVVRGSDSSLMATSTVTVGAGGEGVYLMQVQRSSEVETITTHTLTDDGSGGFIGSLGTVNYSGRSVTVRLQDPTLIVDGYKSDKEDAAAFVASIAGAPLSGGTFAQGGEYTSVDVSDTILAGGVTVRYVTGSPAPVAQSESQSPPPLYIDLCPYTSDRIVPNSLRFTWMGHVYEDIEGTLYRDPGPSDPGTASGSVNYAAGVALLDDWVVGANPQTITLQSLWTGKGDWRTASVFFMTGSSPVQPGQITITVTDVEGNLITVNCDLNGNLTGDHALGKFEFQNGLGELMFGDLVDNASLTADDKAEWWYSPGDVGAVEAGKIWRPWPVDPSSLRYNVVTNFYLPVDPVILGLDPVRLPQDGRVPVFKKGRVLVIGHNDRLAPATYSNSQTIDCGRTRLSHVWLIGADGKLITDGFTATETDLDAGQIHVTDVTGWAQPVTVEHRIQDMALCTDVQIDGTLGLNIPLSHAYPAGSVVSSAVLYGTTFARVASVFDQQTWDGITWRDSVQGNPAIGTYNDTAYPLAVTNAGALSDRYALRIKSDATTYELISEHMGTLGSGSINADFAPNSPVKPGVPTPLFQIDAAGWGGSWVAGNVVFLGIQAAMQSMAVIRTVQPGTPSGVDYSFDLLTGGDIDRPPSAP